MPSLSVTVTSFPELLATTVAPTKLKLVAVVVIFDPSSFTMISLPAAAEIDVSFSSRYLPVYRYADAVTGAADLAGEYFLAGCVNPSTGAKDIVTSTTEAPTATCTAAAGEGEGQEGV